MRLASLKNSVNNWIALLLRVPLVGFDVSDESVKYAAFRPRANGLVALEYIGELRLRPGLIVKGEIQQPDMLAATLREWAESNSQITRSSFCAVSLPEEKSYVRIIQLPHISVDQIKEAVRWEIESHIPLPEQDLVYDYEIIEPLQDHLDHRDILITAFSRTIASSYLSAFKNAGMRVAALELESQAIVRAIVQDLSEGDATLIIDLGRLRTSFILFAGGATLFTSTIQIGGNLFEEHIKKILGVKSRRAAAIKKEFGLDRTALDGKVFEALVPPLSVLTDELQKAMSYFRENTQHRHGVSPDIRQVLLTGGDANLLGLDAYVSRILNIPARRAHPFSALKKTFAPWASPPMPDNKAMRFTTAIGLALRGLRE